MWTGAFSWTEFAAAHQLGPLPPVTPGVRLHKGLFAETLPPFLMATPRQRPLAWASIDCDLYRGTRDVLQNIGTRLRRGTRLHFHELMKLPDIDRAVKWLESTGSGRSRPKSAPGNAIPPSDEARALHEWLHKSERNLLLELDATRDKRQPEAAVFIVRHT